jgi:hypothetical protein
VASTPSSLVIIRVVFLNPSLYVPGPEDKKLCMEKWNRCFSWVPLFLTYFSYFERRSSRNNQSRNFV